MSIEQTPSEPSYIDEIVKRTVIPESAKSLWKQENQERRQLFDDVYGVLNELPLNQDASSEAPQALYRLWRSGDDGSTWERCAIVARKHHDESNLSAWHVIINDISNIDGGMVVNYAEYVLTIGRRLIDFRSGEAEVRIGQPPTRDSLAGIALIQERGFGFNICRGTGSHLLTPPIHWDITEAPERYAVHDALTWLLAGLREIRASSSAFSEGVLGDIH